LVREDVSPSVPSQQEEHQDKDQLQEVNVDPTDTFVLVVPLKNGFEAEAHGNVLEVQKFTSRGTAMAHRERLTESQRLSFRRCSTMQSNEENLERIRALHIVAFIRNRTSS
jgi:microcystin degradation protein MlrC